MKYENKLKFQFCTLTDVATDSRGNSDILKEC